MICYLYGVQLRYIVFTAGNLLLLSQFFEQIDPCSFKINYYSLLVCGGIRNVTMLLNVGLSHRNLVKSADIGQQNLISLSTPAPTFVILLN